MRARVLRSRPVLGLVAVAALSAGCAEPGPRNVLLIVVDTLRADHLGLHGYERPTSPNLDRRADSGVVFDRAFSSSSWTVPAFASMLTGLPPSAHGAGFEVEGAAQFWERTALREGVASLTQRLDRNGFRTIGFLSNAFLEPRFGLDRGFDAYHLYERERGADHAIDAALEWISANGDEPFFMLLHFMEPHAPYAPPEAFRGRFTGESEFRKVEPLKVRRARASVYEASDRDYLVGRYDEEIAALDERLERLFDGLGERWSDTLIVFASDHGEEFLEHGSFDHGHSMMQELLHVPLMLWAPGVEPRRVDAPVSLADVTPTILEAVGLPWEVRSPVAGRSLWGLVSGDEAGPERDLLAEGLLFGSDRKALIRWPYKLVLDPSTGERRLVDLVADPEERRDIAPERPELADEMEEALRARTEAAGERSAVSAGEVGAETARELEALGYVN